MESEQSVNLKPQLSYQLSLELVYAMSPAVSMSPVHRKFVKQDSVKAKALAKAPVAEQTYSSSQIISLEEKYGAHK